MNEQTVKEQANEQAAVKAKTPTVKKKENPLRSDYKKQEKNVCEIKGKKANVLQRQVETLLSRMISIFIPLGMEGHETYGS